MKWIPRPTFVEALAIIGIIALMVLARGWLG